MKKAIEPAERATARHGFGLSPASRAQSFYYDSILGLAPQALCFRPLRGLNSFMLPPLRGLNCFFYYSSLGLRGLCLIHRHVGISEP